MTWQPDYVTLAEFRQYVTQHVDTIDDTWLSLSLTAASRAVDGQTHRQFGLVASSEQRQYTAWYNSRRARWVVDIDDLMTSTGLTITVTDVGTVDAYDLEPINASFKSRPWTALSVKSTSSNFPTGADHEMVIDATWGWSSVPDTVKNATLLQGLRFYMRRSSPYGVAGSPDQGSELRLLDRVDPDVAVMLTDYGRDQFPA